MPTIGKPKLANKSFGFSFYEPETALFVVSFFEKQFSHEIDYSWLIQNNGFMSKDNLQIATLGGGCFWCIEAVFDELEGIEDVISGYAGGHKENPTYQEVCTGTTGHAEVVQIKFDPDVISYEDILRVFFSVHDPTTLNRQGNDIGTQYRSVIFYHSEEQKKAAEKIIQEISEAKIYKDPIVTELTEFKNFYPAEDYHQEYFARNPYQPYCMAVVAPKVAKFRKTFADRIKKKKVAK